MSTPDLYRQTDLDDGFRGGVAGALVLHAVFAGALVAVALFAKGHHDRWGENADVTGAIQASMVSALPLPPKAPPVDKQVLASENENPAPPPPPKQATAPPPKPTDILIKAPTKTPPPKVAPKESVAPPPKTPVKPATKPETVPTNPAKHPQPVPETPKATSGETTATQLPSSVTETRNGTATASVQDRTFGNRYAYYLRIVSQRVSQNWQASEADPSNSVGKRATVLFTIDRDGVPQDIHVQTPSGSPTLDASAKRAVQRVEGFGPLPAGDHIEILFHFDYKAP